MTDSKFKSIRYTNRWFCYVDLLGFSALVESQRINRVIDTYGEVLDEMELVAGKNKTGGIYYSWFSDTFILYSRGAQSDDFARLESASRIFFQKLILKKIPARGAISFGKLYSHLARNIFVGPALIDAYLYGEDQDWLGFLLTPSASDQLDSIGLSVSQRPFYRPIPKKGILRKRSPNGVHAYAFNNVGNTRPNPFLKSIREMESSVDSEYREKYKKTVAFLETNQIE